jgi:hypothetical protein
MFAMKVLSDDYHDLFLNSKLALPVCPITQILYLFVVLVLAIV